MIDVRMGKQDEIQFRIRNRQRLIHEQVLPLFHAEVDDALSLPGRNQGTGARDLVRRAVKPNLHPLRPPSVYGSEWIVSVKSIVHVFLPFGNRTSFRPCVCSGLKRH